MCFSASASFIASGGLAAVGAASAHVAQTKKSWKNWLIVAIPFLFAIQQAFEGIQWLSDRGGLASTIAGYGFLFFALFFWPIYVPLAVFILDPKRRHIHEWFVGIGAAVALYLFFMLLTQPFAVGLRNWSIDYQFNSPSFWYAAIFYVIAVCGAPILSTHRFFRWLGALGFLTAVLAWWVYYETFVSVWCFFAALMSSSAFVYLLSV